MSRTRSYKIALPSFPIAAWLFMLGVGVWHSEQHAIPTIGYWPALIICAGLALVAEELAKFETKETWR